MMIQSEEPRDLLNGMNDILSTAANVQNYKESAGTTNPITLRDIIGDLSFVEFYTYEGILFEIIFMKINAFIFLLPKRFPNNSTLF